MPKIRYINKSFIGRSLDMIGLADCILNDYTAQGLTLTLRQLYYQFVARGHLPNNMRSYKVLQNLVNEGRLAGHLDWDAIEDRTRNLETFPYWGSPEEIISSAASGYREDLWSDQSNYVEVWVEKDALLGVVERACQKWRTPYFSCRGYTSQSEIWRAARRLHRKRKPCTILHLGDHDPSGVVMSRDIQDRLELFGATAADVKRIALTMDQINQYNPPPNPAKTTDSRCADYIARFGEDSWELDALEPNVLIDLIHTETEQLVQLDRWQEAVEEENKGRSGLAKISNRYEEVVTFLTES